jgi:hypothetical protein
LSDTTPKNAFINNDIIIKITIFVKKYDPPELIIIFEKHSNVLEQFTLQNETLSAAKLKTVKLDRKAQFSQFLENFSFDLLRMLSDKERKHCLIGSLEISNIKPVGFRVGF